MAVLGLLSFAQGMPDPSGLWENLLLNVFDFISSYGWRIVVFTVLLKLVLSPLDILSRVMMRKNQKITARIKPELDQIKLQYGHNRSLMAQKQMELNKREGISPFSMLSSCLPMIVTIVIFFWMLAGMRNMGNYMTMKQYLQMYDIYNETSNTYCLENGYEWVEVNGIQELVLTKDFDSESERDAHIYLVADAAKQKAQQAVYDAYYGLGEYAQTQGLQERFMWVKNVWSPDVFWEKPILSYEAFIKGIAKYGTEADRVGVSNTQLRYLTSDQCYNNVTALLQKDENNKVNGLLLFPLLSVGLTFLQQFITIAQQKKSGQQVEGAAGSTNMKMMMIIMPLMMGYFALSYTAVFTLYIFVSTAVGLVLNMTTTSILALIDKLHGDSTKTKVVSSDGEAVIRYGRPDPNANADKGKDKRR